MNNEYTVLKRDGHAEMFDAEKIHNVLFWACENIDGVSVSEIEMKANVQLYNEISTDNVHELLIKSTADLINEETPNYQFVAARLINYKLRKNVYGGFDRESFLSIIKKNINSKVYNEDILTQYTEVEIAELDEYIKDDRDFTFTYAAMEQWREKYLVQLRGKSVYFETPQIAYMMIAATLFQSYPASTRMRYVKKYYDAISQFYISLPTPIMAGLRTPTKQFSSCVLIEAGDSLDSINASASSIVNYISRKAGIGLGVGAIRAQGSTIRNGDVVHTGLIPFIKYFQAAVKSCSQGGVRGGAATLHYPLWHREFENLIVLKNNKGTEETRVRQLDYSVQLNKLMYERLLSGGDITFFSPADVPGLYDAFFADQDEFKTLYEKYEKTKSIEKITRSALDVFSDLIRERKETGRIYIQHVDHVNDHGSFIPSVAPIRMSNLCLAGDTKIDAIVDGQPIFGLRMDKLNDSLWPSASVKVLSYNIDKNVTEYKKVTNSALMKRDAKVMKITDDVTGKSITCTEYHKVYTQNRGYVEARYLTEDDILKVS